MNKRIEELALQAGPTTIGEINTNLGSVHVINIEKFAEMIVKECADVIHLECEDFANGNCFHDDELWKSVTTEYGKNKERGFDPVGMSIHFDKMLKKHFGVEK